MDAGDGVRDLRNIRLHTCVLQGRDRIALRAEPTCAHGICVLMIHPGWMRTSMGGFDAPLLPTEGAMKVNR